MRGEESVYRDVDHEEDDDDSGDCRYGPKDGLLGLCVKLRSTVYNNARSKYYFNWTFSPQDMVSMRHILILS